MFRRYRMNYYRFSVCTPLAISQGRRGERVRLSLVRRGHRLGTMTRRQDNAGQASASTTSRVRPGRIAAVYAHHCLVWSAGEEVMCSLRGSLKGRNKAVVGDRVEVAFRLDGSGTVTAVHPRQSELIRLVADRKRASRPPVPQVLAANVDRVVVVASVRRPPLRPGLLDRFLAAAAMARIAPLICITKLDLDGGGLFQSVLDTYAPLDMAVLGTDIHKRQTLVPLAAALKGHTSVLVGHSGVGKTSLLNALTGLEMAVRDVGFHKDRGRHATNTARLIRLQEGGFAIDSPGIREFGLQGIAPPRLAHLYPDFAGYLDRCKFSDCLHQGEPDCAVFAAVHAGGIAQARYDGYLKLLGELEQAARTREPRYSDLH